MHISTPSGCGSGRRGTRRCARRSSRQSTGSTSTRTSFSRATPHCSSPGSRRVTPSCCSGSRITSPAAASRSSAAGGWSRTAISRPGSPSCGRRCTGSATCVRRSGSPRPWARTSTRSVTTRRFRRSSPRAVATRTSSCAPGRPRRQFESPIFWWESPDGSRVLAYRIPHEYCAPQGRHRRAR